MNRRKKAQPWYSVEDIQRRTSRALCRDHRILSISSIRVCPQGASYYRSRQLRAMYPCSEHLKHRPSRRYRCFSPSVVAFRRTAVLVLRWESRSHAVAAPLWPTVRKFPDTPCGCKPQRTSEGVHGQTFARPRGRRDPFPRDDQVIRKWRYIHPLWLLSFSTSSCSKMSQADFPGERTDGSLSTSSSHDSLCSTHSSTLIPSSNDKK
ncbi:hypothetical protein BJV77DRAFT_63925 [Russula vinacea]|nr:hypothetical protein BJV77DRAFT_63925 [Russula vinacea]